MYRSSLPYGRKGLALMAISVADLALWDLLGQLRAEPVYRLAGGATKDRIAVYSTGPDPTVFQRRGFFGSKVPLPYGPADGREGFAANVRAVAAHRAAVGDGYSLMIDCFMALDVPYARWSSPAPSIPMGSTGSRSRSILTIGRATAGSRKQPPGFAGPPESMSTRAGASAISFRIEPSTSFSRT
jgi:hypothetical protein